MMLGISTFLLVASLLLIGLQVYGGVSQITAMCLAFGPIIWLVNIFIICSNRIVGDFRPIKRRDCWACNWRKYKFVEMDDFRPTFPEYPQYSTFYFPCYTEETFYFEDKFNTYFITVDASVNGDKVRPDDFYSVVKKVTNLFRKNASRVSELEISEQIRDVIRRGGISIYVNLAYGIIKDKYYRVVTEIEEYEV